MSTLARGLRVGKVGTRSDARDGSGRLGFRFSIFVISLGTLPFFLRPPLCLLFTTFHHHEPLDHLGCKRIPIPHARSQCSRSIDLSPRCQCSPSPPSHNVRPAVVVSENSPPARPRRSRLVELYASNAATRTPLALSRGGGVARCEWDGPGRVRLLARAVLVPRPAQPHHVPPALRELEFRPVHLPVRLSLLFIVPLAQTDPHPELTDRRQVASVDGETPRAQLAVALDDDHEDRESEGSRQPHVGTRRGRTRSTRRRRRTREERDHAQRDGALGSGTQE